MNIVVPMAGDGQRFKEAGYQNSKPFIDVNGVPMIIKVLKNAKIDYSKHNLILICRAKDVEENDFENILNQHGISNYTIIKLDKKTDGAAQTVLKAKHYIDNDEELLMFNSDQLIQCDMNSTLSHFSNYDGGILCFDGHGNEWSYAQLEGDYVVDVKEKVQISNHATAGYYFWKRGKDFVSYTEEMISNNDRSKNEFYVAPVYNYAIKDGKKIVTYMVDKIDQLGTPEWLEQYLNG